MRIRKATKNVWNTIANDFTCGYFFKPRDNVENVIGVTMTGGKYNDIYYHVEFTQHDIERMLKFIEDEKKKNAQHV